MIKNNRLYSSHLIEDMLIKKGESKMKLVTAAIIKKDNKILIAQRSKKDKLSSMLEFPGGKIEEGETPEECLKREIKEELDIEVSIGKFFGESIYHYEGGNIKLFGYYAFYESGDLKFNVHDEVKWVTLEEIKNYNFAPADIPFVEKFIKE